MNKSISINIFHRFNLFMTSFTGCLQKKYLKQNFFRKTTLPLPIYLFFTLIKTLDIIFERNSNITSWSSEQIQAES